jgi:hypothetical protein
MKSRSEIWLSALDTIGAQCSVDTTRDGISVTRRIETEGDAFFTKTLPNYAKDLERCLDSGSLQAGLFKGWQRGIMTLKLHASEADPSDMPGLRVIDIAGHGLPKFLGGFMSIIFNPVLEISNGLYESSVIDDTELVPLMRCTTRDEQVAQMASAIRAVRQLCLMFSKEKDLCSDDLIDKAVEKYVQLDVELMRPLSTRGGTLYFRAAPYHSSNGY